MSDTQLPPDPGRGDDPPLRPAAEPGNEHHRIGDPETLDDGAPLRPLVQIPDAPLNGSAHPHGSGAPQQDAAASSVELSPEDLQPMLDLRPPETVSPDDVVILAAEPADPEAPGFSSHDTRQEVLDAEPSATFDADDATPQPLSDEPADASISDAPTVVSPIFSALDAAERAATLHRAEPVARPVDAGILLPRSAVPVEDAVLLEEQPTDPHGSPEDDFRRDTEPMQTAAGSDDWRPAETAAELHAEEAAPEVLEEDAAEGEAAARIAAEANATAAALENLKRLLVESKLTTLGVAPPPSLDEMRSEHAEPPPIPLHRPPAQLPVIPPPMVAPPTGTTTLSFADHDEGEDEAPPRRWRGAAVGSFFAGFALSWVFGAVLYVYLTAG